jgi:putative ABC transport system substrate-binding protein
MASHIERRKFLATLGGAAVAWPLAARAQQGERMRRIGVFFAGLERGDPEVTARVAAFQQALAGLGWIDGGNVRIDYRWGGGDADLRHKYAAELIALGPDTILAVGSPSIAPLLQAPGPFQSCS